MVSAVLIYITNRNRFRLFMKREKNVVLQTDEGGLRSNMMLPN